MGFIETVLPCKDSRIYAPGPGCCCMLTTSDLTFLISSTTTLHHISMTKVEINVQLIPFNSVIEVCF